jgi:anti-sigma-K factor RskA
MADMMNRNHPTELLPAYALGCLERGEAEEAREHLRQCADCRAELRIFEEIGASLAFAAPAAASSPLLRARVLALTSRVPSPGWFVSLLESWPRLLPAATLTAFILVGILGWSTLLLWQRLSSAPDAGLSQVQLVKLQGTAAAPVGSGILALAPGAKEAVLEVQSLPLLDSARQYQLWLIKAGRRTSGGVFSVAADGSARLLITAATPLDSFDAFGITVEPYGGSSGPTGQKVLGGRPRG